MKTKKNIHTILILLVGIIGFFACSKKSDNPVAPGNQTTELKLTFGSQQLTFTNGIGGYAINDDISYIQFTKAEAGDTLLFFMIFNGKTTGNQTWDSSGDTGVLLYQFGTSGVFIFSPSNGSTNITAYGNVGGFISGTFNGQLTDQNNSTVNVNGTFSVQRSSDIQTFGGESKIKYQRERIE